MIKDDTKFIFKIEGKEKSKFPQIKGLIYGIKA